jgi:hypothetical protein
MPTYCTTDDVLAELPDSPSSKVTDKMSTDITKASQLVESGVGSRFPFNYESNTQKFPDISSSPATPTLIRQAATYYTAYFQWLRIKETINDGDKTQAQEYRDLAESFLEDIREGRKTVDLSAANIMGTSLLGVEDTQYADEDTEIFTKTELDNHWP